MKKLLILTGALTVFTLMSFESKKWHSDTYKVDTRQSVLEWYGEKLTGKHHGTIMLSAGEIKIESGNFSGSFEFDMTTIQDKDMEDANTRGKLESHLKSQDFFDVEKYPKSKFVLTSVTPIPEPKRGEATHTVNGLLTIKNKTNPISFDANINIQDNKASCIGSAVVDRSKFDVRYGSKTFFTDIGDKMIYDEFTLKFKVVATKSM